MLRSVTGRTLDTAKVISAGLAVLVLTSCANTNKQATYSFTVSTLPPAHSEAEIKHCQNDYTSTYCLEQKADKYDPEALFILGKTYIKSADKAVIDKGYRYLGFAAGLNHIEALYTLGMFYEMHDPPEAIWYLTRAAKQNHVDAQVRLGHKYFTEMNNKEEAMKWFERASKNGHAGSQAVMAAAHRHGDYGYKKDSFRAFELMRSAAKKGYSPAQADLATMYANGIGTNKDTIKAFTWAERAALQGNEIGIADVIAFYASGTGVVQDNQKVCEWALVGKALGHDAKFDDLNDLCKKGYDDNQYQYIKFGATDILSNIKSTGI